MNNWLEYPLFIGGHRKSGTTLINCLLDGHTELTVLPYDSGFFYSYYPEYAENKYSDSDRIDRAVQYLCWNDLVDQMKIVGTYDSNKKNIEKLERKFRDLINKNRCTSVNILKMFILAFYQTFNSHRKSTVKRWVEKTTSSEIYAKEIFKWFPQAKFIHLIRDPRDNYASLKSGWDVRYKERSSDIRELIQSMIDRGKLGMELAKHNLKRYGSDKYMIIKFEELTTNPENTMNLMCEFIGIDYNVNLLRPTVLGKLWKGNNLKGKKFNRPSNVNVNKWRERIAEDEAKLIEYHFAHLMDNFGYQRVFDLLDCIDNAVDHYKWYNYSQSFKV